MDSEKIINMYNSGQSCYKIAKTFKTYPEKIRILLKKNNITRRPNGQIHHFNDTVFDKIDTEEKAYWLGFIMGDGSVVPTSLILELSNKDIEQLEKLNRFLLANRTIRPTKNDCSVISFNSKYLVKSLSKYGIVPNKTYKDISTPKIPKKLLQHFYRGILDSDGWITTNGSSNGSTQYCFGFSSYNLKFLEEIQNWISKQIKVDCGYLTKRVRNNQQVCQLLFGGNKNFCKIYELLYKDSTISLDRKYKIVTNYYNQYLHK